MTSSLQAEYQAIGGSFHSLLSSGANSLARPLRWPSELIRSVRRLRIRGVSVTEGRLVAATEQALRQRNKGVMDPVLQHVRLLDADRHYFVDVIEPLLDHPLVNFIGEIGEDEKNDFLGDALALLFPIDWPEPFGLVMIESLATGTPVNAYSNGSVPEIVEEGRTGFMADNLNAAVRAVGEISTLSRRACRASFEKRFAARRMAVEYVALYERLLSGSESPSSGELMLVRPAA